MPSVTLIAITCQNAQEGKDELKLKGYKDDVSDRSLSWKGNLRRGDSRSINETRSFDDEYRVKLYEMDKTNPDDFMGSITFTDRDVGRGEQRHVFSRRGGRYTLTFVVTEDEQSSSYLEIFSLKCNDAQEVTDEPYITLNDRVIWGPAKMKTGEHQRIDRELSYHDHAFVEVWESDSRRSDKIGSSHDLAVYTGGPPTTDPLTHETNVWTCTFEKRGSNLNDAKYTLYYRRRTT